MLTRIRGFAAIFALALLVRFVALYELHGSPWNDILLGDSSLFDAWGRRIAGGEVAGGEVFYQAPLYPYFLGGMFALFGHALGAVRLVQCTLGALAAVLIAAGTGRFASRRAGWIAGVMTALYAPAIWYDLQIEKTSLATSFTAALFFLMSTRAAETPATPHRWPGTAMLGGLALGALILLRENAAVLALPLGMAYLGRGSARRGRTFAALGVGLALFLVPVAWHNYTAGGVPLPTTSNAGVNFYIGNGADADGRYRSLIPGRGHPRYEREDATRIAEQSAGHQLSPAGVSNYWFGLAIREIKETPGHFAWLVIHKIRNLLHPSEIMDAVAFESFQDESRVLRTLGLFSFGIVLPLGLAGAVLAVRRRGAALALVAAGLLALSILAFFVAGRFRLGLVPFLIPLAALALDELRSLVRRPAAMALLAVGVGVAWWPLEVGGDQRAASASNLASEYLRRAEFPAAERWARFACTRAPHSAEASYNLGLALLWQKEYREAWDSFRKAMRLEPAYAADCLVEMSSISVALGDSTRARALLEQALTLDGGDIPQTHIKEE